MEITAVRKWIGLRSSIHQTVLVWCFVFLQNSARKKCYFGRWSLFPWELSPSILFYFRIYFYILILWVYNILHSIFLSFDFIDIYKEFSSISIHVGDFWITYKVIQETQVWHLPAFYTNLWLNIYNKYSLVNVFLLNLPSLLGVPYLRIPLWHRIPLWPPWVLLYLDPLALPGKITVTSATVMQDMLLMWGKSVQLILLARDS